MSEIQHVRNPLEEKDAQIAALVETVQVYHQALLTVQIAMQNGFPPIEELLPYIRQALAQGAESKA